jgi:hypothetical protein
VLGIPDRSRGCLFDPRADYDTYVDGKPRADGTRSFLRARGIDLPEGSDSDPPGTATIAGLSSLKDQIVLRKIADGGVQVYPGSIRYLHAAGEAGADVVVRDLAELLDER